MIEQGMGFGPRINRVTFEGDNWPDFLSKFTFQYPDIQIGLKKPGLPPGDCTPVFDMFEDRKVAVRAPGKVGT